MSQTYLICACGHEKTFHKHGSGKCDASGCSCGVFVAEDEVTVPQWKSKKSKKARRSRYDFRMEFEREDD